MALVEDNHRVLQVKLHLIPEVLIYQVIVRDDCQVTLGYPRPHQIVGAGRMNLTELGIVWDGERDLPGQFRCHIIYRLVWLSTSGSLLFVE